MNSLLTAGLLVTLCVLLVSCSGDASKARDFAADCYNMETMLQRNTGDIKVKPEDKLSKADKQNGISWRGSVWIEYTINNPYRNAWQDGVSVYNLVKKNGKFEVEYGRACKLWGSPGMVIP